MEEQYREASEWIGQMGQGILEKVEDITAYVMRIYPFFNDIDGIS